MKVLELYRLGYPAKLLGYPAWVSCLGSVPSRRLFAQHSKAPHTHHKLVSYAGVNFTNMPTKQQKKITHVKGYRCYMKANKRALEQELSIAYTVLLAQTGQLNRKGKLVKVLVVVSLFTVNTTRNTNHLNNTWTPICINSSTHNCSTPGGCTTWHRLK